MHGTDLAGYSSQEDPPNMITDLTIESLAMLMIEKYGEEASFTAVERSRVLRDCGDGQSSRAWLSISRKIDRIAPALPKSDPQPAPEHMVEAPSQPEPDAREERVREPELV